ncbi:MOSC domain-containing protein [Leifsonia shinshuensis]|uniref:MOSC domain-containing protein YiiM n=1 Tax=Leifsonia shinshuensis TaxID=150026 RepID=A0A853CM17_9MICO|nr:MOSC domain-containing protein [Leifsonia shinshuensis]NYJ21856.1 MOSC domain-containing protein YiiM [Leifsonia shinshuensis]
MTVRDGAAQVLAVCRVAQLRPDAGNVGVTAIDKQPVESRLKVRGLGLYGDVQADRKHHGGSTKALYAYAEEAAQWWAAELGRPVPPGLFGENLRTSGLDVDGAEIGERWRIGDSLVVEVTCPRTPCATFQRRMGEPQWVRRFTEAGRVGAYLAVVHTGTVGAGDRVGVVRKPGHGVTIESWFTGADADQADALVAAEEAGALELAREMRESIAKVRGRAA